MVCHCHCQTATTYARVQMVAFHLFPIGRAVFFTRSVSIVEAISGHPTKDRNESDDTRRDFHCRIVFVVFVFVVVVFVVA